MNYLDHAATTPMRPEALAAYAAAHTVAGNPSSLHAGGRQARRVVEESRETLAAELGCRPSELIFTGGGTESDNLALKGLYWARRAADPRRRRVLVTAVEHHAVLDPAHWLGTAQGAVVEPLPVDATGRLAPEALAEALAAGTGGPDDVAVVSVMWANNEVGTVQPVAELAELCHAHGVPFHTDAVQAFGQVPLSFAESGVDAMTVTAHKIGGPVGVGALLTRRGLALTPLTHGGGQERDVRSGTLDTAGAAAFAAAAVAAVRALPTEAERLGALRDELVRQVVAAVPAAVLNGAPPGPGRLPGNAHLSFPGCEGDSLLMLLDARGIACSTGSACTSGVATPSHVLLAMGAGEQRARGSLRFSLGHTSTEADVAAVAAAIGPVVERASRAGELAGLG
ncbi:cysteine desulfurase [Frankia sp. CNm7]|uniref:cysteine desulfurase n=1 Tax=Frankia nepalensis TaxID=1836974 RepID=A0A937UNR4_9ACTN|nr:cysteine desulfurase family protein [Frankia nepalensis]MBL7499810.1 cysteine desulfurase [Frankia nepalensis]MBL7511672.1 cysteine desulfurase [Frankia nepalensis]MBL7523524.1 cysteine desulfurase [Frankia nepalensis]MBL7628348.1 cysteine desulfurase [Frankia nepalensis]